MSATKEGGSMEGIKVGDLVLYDVETLSKLLDVQERTIRKYLRDGKLKGRKLARKWFVTEESLQAYFEQPEELELESQPAERAPDIGKLRLGPPGEEMG